MGTSASRAFPALHRKGLAYAYQDQSHQADRRPVGGARRRRRRRARRHRSRTLQGCRRRTRPRNDPRMAEAARGRHSMTTALEIALMVTGLLAFGWAILSSNASIAARLIAIVLGI